MSKGIFCEIHGENEACMLCQHLINEVGKDYTKVLIKPEDDDYETAMCVDCETLLLDSGEWGGELDEFAQWKLFCRKCYEKALKKHDLVAEGYMK